MATSSDFTTSNKYIVYDIVVTENSTSIPNNTSSVNIKVRAWRTNTGYTTYGSGTCYVNIDGTEYDQYISPDQKIEYESDTVLFDEDVTITHNADGKKTIYVSAYIDHSRFDSNSQGFNVTLSTIPRQANLVSAPNFYDVDNPTITYSNPAGNISAITSLQACISLTGAVADVPYRDISKTGTSYTFNLTSSERLTLLNACPNSNTLSVRFIIRTVLSGQTYYSTLIRTMTVKDANPIITGASYRDINSTTTAITNNNQQIIQGQSTVRFNFSRLTALKGSTLSRVDVTVNAATVSASLSGSMASDVNVSFGAINSSSNISASIKLTDSRGNSTTQSLNITMLAWSLPTAIISLSRKSNYYDETYIKVNADYSSLDNKNSITIQYQYKETSGSTWSALTSLQDDVQATISLDNTKSFDFKIFVTDRIGSTTYNAVLQIGIPILFIDKLKRSVGVGTIPDQTNQLAVDRRIELKNTLQENVADLWSTVTTGNYRSAFLIFRNQNNNGVLQLGGDTNNGQGYVRVNNASGNNLLTLGQSNAGGGNVQLRDANGDYRGAFYKGTNGGALELFNEDDNQALKLWIGSNKDGIIDVGQADGTINASIAGRSGKFTGYEYDVKSSGVVNAWIKQDQGDGQFVACNSSGSDLAWLYVNSGGRLWLANSSHTATITAYGDTGNVTCISVTQTSSRKVKENIKPMNIDEARKILGLQAVSFDFKDKDQGTDKRGFIAEDVAEIIPQLVTPETETEPAKLDYIQMIPYLLETIKNQERRIQDLEAKIEELSKKLT
jgi:hypothetical protein